MRTVKVKKDVLIEKLRANRESHRGMFLKALEGYKQTAIEELEKRLEDAKNNKKINVVFFLQEPQDQTKDYDRVIQMLEMSVDDEIELSSQEFQNYVMDDWSWKENFVASNAMYINKASVR